MIRNKYPQKQHKRLYSIYHSVKKRCYNQKSIKYTDYGAKGIVMCDEWLKGVDYFIEWALTHGYEENLTLDRVDNNKGYCPDNCRWATYSQQMCNKKKTKLFEYNGELLSVKEWSDKYALPYSLLYQRLVKLNWSIERALFEDNKYNNTFKELCKKHNISDNTVRSRLNLGWSLEQALTIPSQGVGSNYKTYQNVVKKGDLC